MHSSELPRDIAIYLEQLATHFGYTLAHATIRSVADTWLYDNDRLYMGYYEVVPRDSDKIARLYLRYPVQIVDGRPRPQVAIWQNQ